MTGPAMVRPASSDFWKAPLVYRHTSSCFDPTFLLYSNVLQLDNQLQRQT